MPKFFFKFFYCWSVYKRIIFGTITNNKLADILDINTREKIILIPLAISVILQGQLSVGELSALLYDIGSDIETDGILNNQDTLNQLKNAASQLVINDGLYMISYNIQQRMEALDVTDYTIPEFEDYVISFLECNPDPPIFSDYIEVHDITSNSVEIRSWVTPNSSETTVTLEYGTTEEYGFTANSMQGTI